MTSRLTAVVFGAHDPPGLARFWAGLLGRQTIDETGGAVALPSGDDTQPGLRFIPSQEPKQGQNRMHFDLTSASLEDQQQTVATALGLGGRHIDVGQLPEEEHVVLADPEGNELCVIEPGNAFLAGCGAIGALACDGSQEVGYFWSKALDWPLVWDQDEETAIQSPRGGTKITWGGPPVAPKTGRNRLHFDLAPADGDLDLRTEVDRLLALGATRLDTGEAGEAGEAGGARSGRFVLADPDGNEFCVGPS